MGRFLTKKEFQNIINETASGFKPGYISSSKPVNDIKQANDTNTEKRIPQQDFKQKTQPIDYDKIELVDDPNVAKGADWAKYGGNFPIKRNGKIYWVSRSVTVSLCAFCKDEHGNWCVLANQRGPGCKTSPGLWNIPSGFLDYGESAEDAAAREVWEETGVDIPTSVPFRLLGTRADSNSENVSMAYTCVLDGTTKDYPLSAENCEPGEVSDIRWIPIISPNGQILKDCFKYKWCRNPKVIIGRAETALTPYFNTNEKYDMLLKKLKQEIGSNPTALFLLDKILAMKNNQQTNKTQE